MPMYEEPHTFLYTWDSSGSVWLDKSCKTDILFFHSYSNLWSTHYACIFNLYLISISYSRKWTYVQIIVHYGSVHAKSKITLLCIVFRWNCLYGLEKTLPWQHLMAVKTNWSHDIIILMRKGVVTSQAVYLCWSAKCFCFFLIIICQQNNVQIRLQFTIVYRNT